MPKAPVAVAADEPDFGVAMVLDREIKVRRLQPDQLLVADMMARRLQRLAAVQDAEGKVTQENWMKFLDGTRRLLDWISNQFVDPHDLDWFEDKVLRNELDLNAIGPLMTAMGRTEPDEAPKPVNRRARRAK